MIATGDTLNGLDRSAVTHGSGVVTCSGRKFEDLRPPGFEVFPVFWTPIEAASWLMSLYPSSYSVGVKYPSVEWRRFVLKSVSYTHLRAHETRHDLVCRLLLEKKK